MTRARRVLAVAALAWTSVPYGAAAQVAAQVAAVKDPTSIAPQVAAPDAPQATGAPHRAQLAAAFPEVGRILEDYGRRAHVPGFAFGILVDGDLVYARGFGVRIPWNPFLVLLVSIGILGGGGYWLYYRLLEAGTFEVIASEEVCVQIDTTQLAMLLGGVSWVGARRRKRYSRAS